jgi:hypothetical protein
MSKTRTLHPNLRIFDPPSNSDKLVTNFTAIPTFFFDDLIRVGKGIPSSFWKFTFALMRQILSPDKQDGQFVFNYTWNSTFADFKEKHDIGDLAVQDWSNAYSVSGLFHIVKGSRKFPKDPNGTPTVWTYNRNATSRDWLAFVLALSETLNPKDGKRMARHGFSKDYDVNASHAFKLVLALNVDLARKMRVGLPPLPPINVERIEAFLRRGYGKRNEDGSIEWTYLKPSWKGLKEPDFHGEPDGSGLG